MEKEIMVMTNFTELEQQVLDSLIFNLYAEPGFSDVDAKDLSKETGISTSIVRGVLSSLIKKGVVSIQATETYGAPVYQLIYLQRAFWHLHPKWVEYQDHPDYKYY
jgi:transcription initiation factor IIE alpha subunit